MPPDPGRLRSISSKTGFRAETLEKVVRLGEVTGDIARHPLLSRVLLLKGGTALNLCFGEPRRLSVDLDFNYIGQLDRKAMLAERPDVERALRNIAGGRQYAVQESGEEHGGRKLYLSYRNMSGSADRIEVDVSYLHRQPLVEAVQLPLWQPADMDRPVASVVGFEELAAGKLVACLDRIAPRDLYDTVRLPSLDERAFGALRFRRIFLALSTVLPHPAHRYSQERFSRVTQRAIETELLPMLSGRERIDAGGLSRSAWSVLSPLLELNPDEKAFVDGVQRGELDPELLAPDDDSLKAIVRRHPAILWKVENAGRHREPEPESRT